MAMQVKRLHQEAVMPVRGSAHAAGFDLAASEATTIKAGTRGIVKTGLSIAIPEGTYARIAPRSGLAVKRGINVGAGVVDFDYRGEVGVVLFNHGMEDFKVEVGDRVAQLILEKVSMVGCIEVESLDETARGVGGFGSTGGHEAVGHTPEPNQKKRILQEDAATPPNEGRETAKLRDEVKVLRQEIADLKAQMLKNSLANKAAETVYPDIQQ